MSSTLTPPAGTSRGPEAAGASTERAFDSQKGANRRAATVLWIVAAVGAVVALIPFYLMLVVSLKTPAETAANPWALPHRLIWSNYVTAWTMPGTDVTFATFFRNTLTIATLTTVGTLISSSMVAFAFARLRFPGRDRLFLLLLATMMLPSIVTMIPQYVGFSRLHWVDTLYPLIIPAFFAGAFNVFLLRQFFMTLPRELDEAARLDGASYFTIYWRVLLPQCKPALVTVGLFAFIYAWKDLIAPLIYLSSPENQTLELGLTSFQSVRQTDWELLMAASVMVLIPLLVIFAIGQRYFIQGIVMSGLKD
jgi:multiple sugar transport system permease protein